jgi:hypothetical protein
MKRLTLLAAVPLTLALAAWMPAAAADGGAPDPAKVAGPDECGECHKDEVAVWRATKHYKSFYELSRNEQARKIAAQMGVKRIKRDSDCVACHFLQAQTEDGVKPVSGVACESCHGAARDWIKVHNDYGGKGVKKDQETAEHRKQRLEKVKAAGMIRPSALYDLAGNCYRCHLVANEKLVNQGGHLPGSEFELVSWSQGEIRHNFFSSPDGKQNLVSEKPRQRMMFVMGRALELEYSLRAVAGAKDKAAYAVTMAKRAKRAEAWLKKINTAVNRPEIADMLAAAASVKLKLNNHDNLIAAADKVAAASRRLASDSNGQDLAGLDELLPPTEKYKGQPAK